MKLIEHIVRNDRPFTEIVTADYIMVTPYTARGYGIFEELKSQVQESRRSLRIHPGQAQGPDGAEQGDRPGIGDGLLPARGPARARSSTCAATRPRRRTATACGRGCTTSISSASTCWSWPPASRMPRRSTAKYPIPTMQASRMRGLPQDARSRRRPVPGLLRASRASTAGAREAGSRTCSPPASRAKTCRSRALAVAAMARRADREGPALRRRDGRTRLLHPHGPQGAAAAEGSGRSALCRQAPRLPGAAPADRSHRGALRQVRLQPQERLQGLDRLRLLPRRRPGHRARPIPSRRAELDDVGLVRMLAPEQVERKVAAVFGQPWGKLQDQLAMLYGGIDSKEVTERAADPERRDGRDPAHPRQRRGLQAHRARFQPRRRRTPALPRHRAGRACPAPPPRPMRRSARPSSTCTSACWAATTPPTPRRSSARSSSSPASSPTPREQKGARRSQKTYSCRPRSADARSPIRTTPSAPGAPWSRTCCAARIPLRVTVMRRDFLKLCGLAGLGLAVPLRLSAARPRAETKDDAYEGPYYVVFNASGGWDTTYLMDPKGIDGINRLYQAGRHPDPGRRTSSPRPRSTSRAA